MNKHFAYAYGYGYVREKPTTINTGGGGIPTPHWSPEGSVLAYEFDEDRYWREDQTLSLNDIQFRRASPAALFENGLMSEFLSDVPVLSPSRGLLLRDAAAQQLPTPDLSVGRALAGAVTYPGDDPAPFNGLLGRRVVSSGTNNAGAMTIEFTWVAGTSYRVIWLYKAGTSGRVRLRLRNDTITGTKTFTGVVGGTLTAADVNTPGSHSDFTDVLIADGVRMASCLFVPASSGVGSIGIGPDLATASADVVFYGANVWATTSVQDFTKAPERTRAKERIGLGLEEGTYTMLFRGVYGFVWQDDVVWEGAYIFGELSGTFGPLSSSFPLQQDFDPPSQVQSVTGMYAFPGSLTTEQKALIEGSF